ncbi:MAG: RNA-binding protein [Proteobacteria bacterium]|nr:RNA-binding protein [Pseudomonadota bacterium]
MASRLFVGNIAYQTQESELETEFSNYGVVKSVKIITDRESGRSKGFGFVEMESDTDAKSAIENLDGKTVGGRPIRVSEAHERKY